MDACFWCIWFNHGRCLVDAPHKEPVGVMCWCPRFAGVTDGIYDVRERMYLLPE